MRLSRTILTALVLATALSTIAPHAGTEPARKAHREYVLGNAGGLVTKLSGAAAGSMWFRVSPADTHVRFRVRDEFTAAPNGVYFFEDADGRELGGGTFCVKSAKTRIPRGTTWIMLLVGGLWEGSAMCDIAYTAAGARGTATASFWR